jgi:hypothetical protein
MLFYSKIVINTFFNKKKNNKFLFENEFNFKLIFFFILYLDLLWLNLKNLLNAGIIFTGK